MALLEEPNCCAICERPVAGHAGQVPVYFCAICFGKFRDDILNRSPWVLWLLAQEKARRKRRNRRIKTTGPTFIVGPYTEGDLNRRER